MMGWLAVLFLHLMNPFLIIFVLFTRQQMNEFLSLLIFSSAFTPLEQIVFMVRKQFS